MKHLFTTFVGALAVSMLSAAPSHRSMSLLNGQTSVRYAQASAAVTDNPEILDHQTFEFTYDQTALEDMTAEMGYFQFFGFNDEGVEAFLGIYSDHVAGHYTIDDIYMGATALYLSVDDYDGVRPFAFTADIVSTGTGYKCTAVYDAENGVEYTLIFNYGEPAPAPTIFDLDGELADYTADQGYFQVSAVDMEYKRSFEFRVNASALQSGTYSDAIDTDHTYFVLYSQLAEVSDILDLVCGNATLDIEDNNFVWSGVFVMKGQASGTTTDYTITVRGEMPKKDGDPYDYADDGFAATYDWSSVELNTEHATEGIIGLDSWNPTEDGLDLLVRLEFNVADADPAHVIPLGTYAINGSHAVGTVTSASLGSSDMVGSYVAYTIYGWTISPLWFISEGTVTVSEGVDGLCVIIDAVNTWGKPISVQIGKMSTVALSTLMTRTQATKAFTAKGLRIISGDKQYDVMGTQVK